MREAIDKQYLIACSIAVVYSEGEKFDNSQTSNSHAISSGCSPMYLLAEPCSVSITAILLPRAKANREAVKVLPLPDGPSIAILNRDLLLIAFLNFIQPPKV